ncbi:MAG: Rhodanese-like domain protein [Chlorobi bacterium]|nr:Rhodanese-like domain protein [Chlorobiota bacterium]
MRNMKVGTLAALLMMAAIGCGKVGDAPRATTDSAAVDVQKNTGGTVLQIDTARSKVSWIGAKITRRHDGGFHKFDGTVTLDGDKVTAVNITVDAASLYTDDSNLVNHLKSPDFFSVKEFPTATFQASQFVKADSPGVTHMVTGNLTMRGITHGVTFPANIQVSNGVVTAKADFKINRKDWKIVYPGKPDDLISDDVRIVFDITTKK